MAYLADLAPWLDDKVLMEDTVALEALHLLNSVVQTLATWPAWRDALAEHRLPSKADLEMSGTEQLILEGLACSILRCEGNATRIEALLSDADPAVTTKIVHRVVLWQKALPGREGVIPWPKQENDILAYVAIKCPSNMPPDFAQTQGT